MHIINFAYSYFVVKKGKKMENTERLKTIDTQLGKLQARKKKIEEKRKNKINVILSRCGAHKMPDELLAGAVLEVVKAFNQNDPRISAWKSEGSKILKPGRGRKKFV